jgi:hypothetical protein
VPAGLGAVCAQAHNRDKGIVKLKRLLCIFSYYSSFNYINEIMFFAESDEKIGFHFSIQSYNQSNWILFSFRKTDNVENQNSPEGKKRKPHHTRNSRRLICFLFNRIIGQIGFYFHLRRQIMYKIVIHRKAKRENSITPGTAGGLYTNTKLSFRKIDEMKKSDIQFMRNNS